MSNKAIVAPLERWMVPALLDMGQELMGLSSYEIPFDRDYCQRLAMQQVSETPPPNFKVWMAWTQDATGLRARGVIMGSVAPMLFTPKLMAVEETVYVRLGTPYRAAVADQLMQTFIYWAVAERKASLVRAGETSGIEPTAVNAFMRRNGLKRHGTLYRLEDKR